MSATAIPATDIRDICRESELTPGEAHAAYLELNGQITVHLDSIVGKMVDATKEFKTHLLPLLDMMQSMLSKRGKLRKLLNSAAVPTWEEWFDDFEKRLHLDISFRTVQRWLKDYREAEGEEPPAPNINAVAKQSVRQIESKPQAEKLESVVVQRQKLDPANRAQLILAIEAKIEKWQALLAKLKKDFVPPVTETGKALPFTQAEIAAAAKEQAAYWREKGFPFHDKSETERGRELHLLLDFDHASLINSGVVRQTMHCLGTAGSYFPHMMSVRSGKFRTPMEVFEDDTLLALAIASRIEADGTLRLTPNQVRKACMVYAGAHAVSNFRPSAAAAIFDKYLPETGGVVFEQRAHNMRKDHNCCYYNCPEPGAIHPGPNGGDSHWICFHHLDRWNKTRARFLAEGGGCEMEELGEPLTAVPSARAVPRTAGFGRLPLRAQMNNANEPEVLAVVPLPSAAERRLREVNLARLMLLMVDIVLAGEGLGLETARDLVRETKHVYPELVAGWDEL